MAFNINTPLSTEHMFGNWLNGIEKSEKIKIKVGVCAMLTAIWHVRNDFIFNKSCFLFSDGLSMYPPYVTCEL
jgi:hypothetical protein